MYFYLLEIVGYIFICLLAVYFWHGFIDYTYAVQMCGYLNLNQLKLNEIKNLDFSCLRHIQVATILDSADVENFYYCSNFSL